MFARLWKSVPAGAWDEMPIDGAQNYKHYLYGHPNGAGQPRGLRDCRSIRSSCKMMSMENPINAAHLRNVDTWASGGGVELDILELDDGAVLIVADDTVAFYRSLDEFWAEVDDGGDGRRTVTILRETGRPFELAGAR